MITKTLKTVMDAILDKRDLFLLLKSINCNKIKTDNFDRDAKNKDMDFSLNDRQKVRSMIRHKSIEDGIDNNSAARQYRKSPHQPDYSESRIENTSMHNSNKVAADLINLQSDRSKSNLSIKMPEQTIIK